MITNRLVAVSGDNGRAMPIDVLVTLDVEWEHHPTNPLRNHVIAYGLRAEANCSSKTLIVYPGGPEWRHRLTLGNLLGQLFSRCIPEVMAECPTEITLVTHYGRGDLAACRDFKVLKSKVDAMKGAFTSAHGSAKIVIDFDEKTGLPADALPRLPAHRLVKVPDPRGGDCMVQVTFRDTSLLVPEGSKRSLDSIGELIGLPKLELPEGFSKARMGEFFAKNRPEAERYLTRDLEVPARFYRRLQRLTADMGLKSVPPTLGAIAVTKMMGVLKGLSDPDDPMQMYRRLFAVTESRTTAYSRTAARYRTTTATEMSLARRMFEPLMGEGYHGGRTETYVTGPTPAGLLLRDIDLKNAYPSAMTAIRVPDYAKAFLSDRAGDFQADALGVAEIDFKNPRDLRFPAFPIRSDHGLIFPMRGRTVATSPEIAAALHLGVEVSVRRGVIIPWLDELRPYDTFVRDMILLRSQLKTATGEDTVESLLVKTVANGLYGKTAQAVRPRNVFDSRTGGDKILSPSSVTNAAFAAFVTGLVRAAIAEMLNSIPSDQLVVSVSTDGFLTSAAIEVIDVSGPACSVLAECRQRVTGDPSLLECKKYVRQVIVGRNRAAFTTMPVVGSKTVTAKGSIKLPAGVVSADEYLVGLYLDRNGGSKLEREDLIALRDQWVKNADLVSVNRVTRLNLEPDYKRDLSDPRMEVIGGGPYASREHLTTSSRPFQTVTEMLTNRGLFEGWRHATGRCLKALDDWEDWIDYRDSTLAARAANRRPHRTAGGSGADLKRQFLRALVREQWGLDLSGRTYAQIAEWLTAAGYATSLEMVKNSARANAKLVPHSITASERTIAPLKVILAAFPAFEYERAFVTGHLDLVRAALKQRCIASLLRPAA